MKPVPEVPVLARWGGQKTVEALSFFAADLTKSLFQVLQGIAFRLNRTLPKDGSEPMAGPVVLSSYTVAGVPPASAYPSGLIYVSNEAGGAVPAFSDGTNWRRVTDRAVVS